MELNDDEPELADDEVHAELYDLIAEAVANDEPPPDGDSDDARR